MLSPLPSKTEQRRQTFRPSLREVHRIYGELNQELFGGKLTRPEIMLGRTRGYWGLCLAYDDRQRRGTHCRIRLSDKWMSPQWLVTILAHEMVHQYQWDIESQRRVALGKKRLVSHGPTFHKWRSKFEKRGLALRVSYSRKKWFRSQDLLKC